MPKSISTASEADTLETRLGAELRRRDIAYARQQIAAIDRDIMKLQRRQRELVSEIERLEETIK